MNEILDVVDKIESNQNPLWHQRPRKTNRQPKTKHHRPQPNQRKPHRGVSWQQAQAAAVSGEIGKRAVENNYSMGDDLHPSTDRKQTIELLASLYFKGDEDKAEEFVQGMELSETEGRLNSAKDTIETVLDPVNTVRSLYETVSNHKEVYKNLVISMDDWNATFEYAIENDPKLAGKMQGYLTGQLKGIPTGGIALSGASVSLIQGISAVSKYIQSGKLNFARKTISNDLIGIEWGKGIGKQGKPWEKYLQSFLPEGTIDLNSIKPNFKTFDHLLPDGTAISAKTMDTVGSKTYQNPSKITYQLNKYIDDMAKFDKDGRGRDIIRNDDISSKELYLAIPAKTTREQMKAINKAIEYGNSKEIKVIIKKVN